MNLNEAAYALLDGVRRLKTGDQIIFMMYHGLFMDLPVSVTSIASALDMAPEAVCCSLMNSRKLEVWIHEQCD